MKYLQYLAFAALASLCVFVPLALFSSVRYATEIVVITIPLALWTGRLIVSRRRGVITRRIGKLDSGSAHSTHVWSFNPDVYAREAEPANFRGYLVREFLLCVLVWVMFLSVSLLKVLSDMGFDV